MQLFVGSFGSCTDPAILSHELCHAAPSAPPALPSSAPPSLSRQLSLDSGGGDGVWLGGGNGGNFGGDANYSVWLGGGADGGNYGGGNYDGSEGGSEGGGGGGGSGGSGGGGLRAWRRLKGGGGNGGAASGPAHWSNPPYGSFDDWGQSMLTLYVMSTGDGWDLVMFSGMDATQADSAPNPAPSHKPNPNPQPQNIRWQPLVHTVAACGTYGCRRGLRRSGMTPRSSRSSSSSGCSWAPSSRSTSSSV